jgi:hypothetical protein
VEKNGPMEKGNSMPVISASYRIAFVRVSIAVVGAIVIAIAFYIGGAAGFIRGFNAGMEVAHITAGGQVLNVLETPDDKPLSREQRLVLEGMLDTALTSYNAMRNLGPSSFDVIGVHDSDRSGNRVVAKIVQYRRDHPSQSESPELRRLIEEIVKSVPLP